MTEVWIKINDMFEELSEENNRLLKELIFAEQCLKKFNDLKIFIDSILDKISIEFNDKQRYEELKNDIDECLRQRSVLSSLKSENTANESKFNEEFSDNFDYTLSVTESNERELEINHRRQLKNERKTDISAKDNSNRKLNNRKKSFEIKSRCIPSNERFVCPVDGCDYKTYLRERYRTHKYIHSEKKLKCPHCDYRSYKTQHIDQHMQCMHLSEVEELIPGLSSDIFKCDLQDCSFVTYKRKALSDHKLTHMEKKYKCPHLGCNYRSVNQKTLSSHLYAIHRKKVEKKIECPHSGCDYKGVKSCLKTHLKTVHNKSAEEKTFSEQYICDNLTINKKSTEFICHFDGCGKQFKCNYYLIQHIKFIHQKDSNEPLKCEFKGCKYSNVNPYNLRRHIAIRHSEKTLKCDYPGCGYGTGFSTSLKQHQKIHSEDKPFGCDWPGCQYRCLTKGSLKIHMEIHTNTVGQFKCPFDGCDKSFKSKVALNNHKMNHDKSQEYSCDWPGCEYKSYNKQNIGRHAVIHSDDKPFACHWPGCQFRTKKSNNLSRHTKIHK